MEVPDTGNSEASSAHNREKRSPRSCSHDTRGGPKPDPFPGSPAGLGLKFYPRVFILGGGIGPLGLGRILMQE